MQKNMTLYHRNLKVLITCLDWRKKYLGAVGDASYFDQVLDITSLVHLRKQYEKFPVFVDTISESCTVVKSFDEFKTLMERLKPALSVILRPVFGSPAMQQYLHEVARNSVKWAICLNRHTIKYISLYSFFRGFMKSFISGVKDLNKTPKPDVLYTNNFEVNFNIIIRSRPRKLKKICHMDHPHYLNSTFQRNEGLFLDSFFPFHVEYNYQYGSISPEYLYSQLEKYLRLQIEKYNLDNIVISAHPNSDGSERYYLKDFDITYAPTAEIIPQYKMVWSFASDSNALAIQTNLYCKSIVFPNLFPDKHIKIAKSRSQGIGVPFAEFDGKVEKDIVKDSLIMSLRRKILKYYMNPYGDTLTDSLKKMT